MIPLLARPVFRRRTLRASSPYGASRKRVRAPLTVEYWKSAPYFLNFLNGYRVGEKVRATMKVPDHRAQLTPRREG